jgi:hypothetical protein
MLEAWDKAGAGWVLGDAASAHRRVPRRRGEATARPSGTELVCQLGPEQVSMLPVVDTTHATHPLTISTRWFIDA